MNFHRISTVFPWYFYRMSLLNDPYSRERPENKVGATDDIILRNETPVTAVVARHTVIAENKIMMRGNQNLFADLTVVSAIVIISIANRRLIAPFSIDKNLSFPDFN